MIALSALVLLLLCHSNADATVDIKQIYENPLAHGFGEDIAWVKWEDAVETALEVNKPIFLLIHKSWCHACKALKKTFQQSNARKAFKKLSEYFVMVNTEDDDEPFEEEYRPDGKYIPRLLFLDKNGDLIPEFKNKKAEYKSYSYYYSSPADVLNSMKDVLRHYNIDVPEMKKGDKLKRRREESLQEETKEEAKVPEKTEKKDEKKESEEEKRKPLEVKPVKKEEKVKEEKPKKEKESKKKGTEKSEEMKGEKKSKSKKEKKSEL